MCFNDYYLQREIGGKLKEISQTKKKMKGKDIYMTDYHILIHITKLKAVQIVAKGKCTLPYKMLNSSLNILLVTANDGFVKHTNE